MIDIRNHIEHIQSQASIARPSEYRYF